MKLVAVNLYSSFGLALTFTHLNKGLGFLVLCTALILNLKKLLENENKKRNDK